MTNRRNFLKMSAAAFAVPSTITNASSLLFSNPTTNPGFKSTPALYKVIFDDRFQESRSFAKEANRFGSTTFSINGDITEVWYRDLYLKWQQKPVAIAGLTTAASLFCLEQLARDQQLRVVFRADHNYRADGSVEHTLSGPHSLIQQEIGLTYSESDWAKRMARLVSHYPTSPAQQVTTIINTPPQNWPFEKESLVSWVIAPR